MVHGERRRFLGTEAGVSSILLCWCGNSALAPFSPNYRKCEVCETLVTTDTPAQLDPRVSKDETDFYGRDYWFSHQEKDLGFPNIVVRARNDLSERCLHWLRTLLKYKTPPARALELGSAHGGFVALLDGAGFNATGLELSPWVAEFARRTFGISQLVGPVEDQAIAPGSLDVVALMDVLEHLPDPAQTMRHCLSLLEPSGVLLVQTPRLPEGKTYQEMVKDRDPFLEQLKSNEHLYLFSQKSIRELFRRLGAPYLTFEPAYFDYYDMFFIGARTPPETRLPEQTARALEASPKGRLVQALLDSNQQLRNLNQRYLESETDRANRLEFIHSLEGRLEDSEQDRAARLDYIHLLEARLTESERDRAVRLDYIHLLEARLAESEQDRAARLDVIERQGAELAHLELEGHRGQSEAAEQERRAHALQDELVQLRDVFRTLSRSRGYRLLRFIGQWEELERALTPRDGASGDQHAKQS